jgi:hypothetical protein
MLKKTISLNSWLSDCLKVHFSESARPTCWNLGSWGSNQQKDDFLEILAFRFSESLLFRERAPHLLESGLLGPRSTKGRDPCNLSPPALCSRLAWARLGSPGLVWAVLGSSLLSWALLGSSGLSIWLSWARLGSPRLVRALLGSCPGSLGPCCDHLGSHGLVWALLGSSGLS